MKHWLVTSPDGRIVEVEAETKFEAIALGLRALRHEERYAPKETA